jgi:hypothetical protein
MALLTAVLGYGVGQHEFGKIIPLYGALFILYLLVVFKNKQAADPSLTFWLVLAVLLRLILVFSVPNLSNDVYRFIWDGRLLAQGYNPFEHLPLYYLENRVPVEGIDRALFEAFDAKNTYTVYPPLAQLQFASACWLFPGSIFGTVVVMKLWLFAFEVGSIFLLLKLLRRFHLPGQNVLFYALNPLIIIEITGNLHFEGAMIFFLLLALANSESGIRNPEFRAKGNFTPFGKWASRIFPQGKSPKGQAGFSQGINRMLSAVAFALSVCSKLLTLMFLPFLIKMMGWSRSLVYFGVVGLVTVALFLPVVNATFVANFGDSLNLYFQKLEYNASLYYLLRWAGYRVYGYNQIALLGPLLGLVALAGILWLAWKTPANWLSVLRGWLFAICFYLLCTTTLHPWYLALPIVLCIFTPYRCPILWSGMIFLTYVNYSYEPFRENLWLVALEYAAVGGWFAWEWKRKHSNLPSL